MSFDEMYDEMLHDEFRSGSTQHGAHASSRSLSGLARYRTAALVGAGGLACATVGAFLGGLGGFFTLFPAAAHSVTSSSERVPLAAAANAAFHAQAVAAPAATVAAQTISKTHLSNDANGGALATFAAAVGPILNGVAPLHAPTTSDAPVVTAPVTGGTSSGAPSTGGTVVQATQILSLGLNDILANLTSALSGVTSLPGNPTGAVAGVVTPLTGVITDVTGTLANLSSLMPLPTLPIGSLPIVSAAGPLTGGATTTAGPLHTATTGTKATPSTPASALTPILSGVAAAVTGSSGAGLPNLPSLPLPSTNGSVSTVPSLPLTTPSGVLPTLPTINLPLLPTTGSSTPTCVSTPALPTSPLPISEPVTINLGIVSVGVSLGGATTDATVCATS